MKKAKDSWKRLKEVVQQRGLRFTRERKAIVEEAIGQKSHFDVEDLYKALKRRGLGISRDTVYRNLPLLLEAGLIQKSVGTGKGEYFERTGTRGHHDHMVCIRCAKVIEFHSAKIERDQEEACREYDFELVFHDHRLFGYCLECRDR